MLTTSCVPNTAAPLPESSGGGGGSGSGFGTQTGGSIDPNQSSSPASQLIGSWTGLQDEDAPAKNWDIKTKSSRPQGRVDVFISLAHPSGGKKESYRMIASVPSSCAAVYLCQGECSFQGATRFPSDQIHEADGRKFFQFRSDALLQDGLILDFACSDASNQPIVGRLSEFAKRASQGTGTGVGTPTGVVPTVQPTGNPGISDTEGKTLMTRYCAGAGCHDNYANNPNGMNKPDAVQRIRSNNMPKGRTMVGADKERLISYLSQ